LSVLLAPASADEPGFEEPEDLAVDGSVVGIGGLLDECVQVVRHPDADVLAIQ